MPLDGPAHRAGALPGGILAGVEPEARAAAAQPGGEARIVALDGLRGLMTILVVLSHYFGEVPNGWRVFATGWIAVDMFFVLSGFLVGRLILDKKNRRNFLAVFYIRRFCRTIPIYTLCVLATALLVERFRTTMWVDADVAFPLWSYLSFSQNFFMVSTGSIGAHWLAPTWTLAVEEHFYLIAPALFLVVPRRHLASVLVLAGLAAVLMRAIIHEGGTMPEIAAVVLLPARADVLICGLLAAVLIRSDGVAWTRLDGILRVLPILLLGAASGLKLLDGEGGGSFAILGPLLVSLACAAFLLTLVRGAPEAQRFQSKVLCFFGQTSYAVYLTHLPILGLMHGFWLGTKPDLATMPQLWVTLAALPLCAAVGWALTKLVEEPITSYGRSWKWSEESSARSSDGLRAALPRAA